MPFLYATIATVLPALVAMVLSFGVYWATTLNLLVLLGLCFGCLGLIRFGWLRLSFQVFFFSGLLYVTGLTLLFGGIEGANSVGYLLLACLVGMSRGWRCGAISIVFCSALAVSVYFLQKYQIVTPQVLPFQAEAGLMTIIVGLVLGGTMLFLALRQHEEALALARRELHERKEMEARLRLVSERFSTAFHASPHPMLISDLHTNEIIDINHTYLENLGYTREEMGTALSDTVSFWEKPERALEAYHLVKKQGYVRDFECAFKGAEGRVERALVSAEIVDIHGRKCIVWQGFDITSQKEEEDRILTLNAALEQRLLEHNQQLEAANKELKSFAYTVSHDLRAPLRGIEAFTKILLKEYAPKLDKDGVHFLQNIQKSSENMEQLIESLLSFSRVGGAQLHKQKVDMRQLVWESIHSLQHEYDLETSEIVIEDVAPAQGDPLLLKQVLTNLLSNAIKFTQHQPFRSIRFGSYKVEDDHMLYYLSDNGVGFDMQYADKIFDVFQRLHSHDEFEGTGAGLAIVHRIIRRHGGNIWVDSAPGEGTTFYFTLEGEEVPEEEVERKKDPSRQTQPMRSILKKGVIVHTPVGMQSMSFQSYGDESEKS